MIQRRRLFFGIAVLAILAGFALSRCDRRTRVVRSVDRYDYLLYLPANRSGEGKRPLLLYLHGSGEVGREASCLKRMHPGYHARKLTDEEFPFVVLCPVTPYRGWNPDQVVDFLDEFLERHGERYRIDRRRIYLTGISMGGYGTFHTAAKHPDRFAAVAPLAGGGSPAFAENLRTVPVWAFHAEYDPVVPYERSAEIIAALENSGHIDVRMTTLHGMNHDVAEPVYGNPELYRWFLRHENEP